MINKKFLRKIDDWDTRSPELIERQYIFEKALASQLRNADIRARKTLYTELYDEFYRNVPELSELLSRENKVPYTSKQVKWIKNFIKENSVFLEIGPGCLDISLAMSEFTANVFAIDVTDKYYEELTNKKNIQFVKFDGLEIPFEKKSVDLVYSDQVIEHLHPEDAYIQIKSVFTVLNDKGIYLCCTPNKLTGPHDVSKYFDEVAVGFHLKEYTFSDIVFLLKDIGFKKFKYYPNIKSLSFGIPISVIVFFEKIIRIMPNLLKKKIVRNKYIKRVLDIQIAAFK